MTSFVGRNTDPRVVGYPQRLSWYDAPPPYELTMDQFERWALDRLAVLKALETAQVRNIRADAEIKQYMKDTIHAHLPLSHNSARDNTTDEMRAQVLSERKKDHTSHFILRLAYARTEDLRIWFVKMETELFRLRLVEESSDHADAFLGAGLGTEVVNMSKIGTDKAFHAELTKELAQMTGTREAEIVTQSFYKVPFQKVFDLVRTRQVVVKRGFAYVPPSLKTTIIVNQFRENLIHALEMTAKALPNMDEDDRLDPILSSISQQYLATASTNYGGTDTLITHADIDGLAAKHFPLCMQTLHKALRSEGHLKHGARLQYGLFIKGIGMSVDEALVFWRKAFHKMNDDQFQKGGYAYSIRHNYGMEGKRSDYAPYSCVRIITSNQPSATEHHGCPFRHHSSDNLKTLLTLTLSESTSKTTTSNSVNEIMKIVGDGHYQIACTRLYEITKGEEGKDTIDHPNMWFELSHGGKGKEEKKAKVEDVGVSVVEIEDVDMVDADVNGEM